MKELLEQDHYEVLEVSRDASSKEIDRGYRVVRSAYEGDSLALYSVFGETEAGAILERIDEAYQILSDSSAREAYDLLCQEKEESKEEASIDANVDAFASVVDDMGQSLSLAHPNTEFREEADVLDEFEKAAGSPLDDFLPGDGAGLRSARIRSDIDLQKVSDVTKISMTNLRNIEQENFEDLPASVYVRGFVMAYAKTIELDAERVAAAYMERVEASRSAQSRGRFLGRR